MTNQRVLCVTGDAELRERLTRSLSGREFSVEPASSGSEGLEKLRRAPFDVLICGPEAGGMSASEVLAAAKRERPHLTLVLLSSAPSPDRKESWHRLSPSLSDSELASAIVELTGGHSSRKSSSDVDEQLVHMIETAPVPYILTRLADGQILYANRHMASMVGLSPQELMTHSSTDFYYDLDDRKTVIERLQRDGHLYDFEVPLKRTDGTPIWTIFSLALTEIRGEAVVLGGVYDVTRRKLAEQELRRERNFVSAILDTAGALVIVLDPEGRIERFNRACEESTGYTFAEVHRQPFWDLLLLPEEKSLVDERFQRLLTGPYPVKGENYWLTKSGERRLIEWSNTALFDEEGRVQHVVAIGIDITEQREAEERLRLYRKIFTNSIDVIVVLDPQGRVVERNPVHEARTGFSDDEVLGRDVTGMIGEERAREIFEAVRRDGFYRGEAVVHAKKGARIDIDLSAFPILDDEGNPIFYVSIGRDISAMKRVLDDLARTNRELRETQYQLVQSEKMASLGSLVAGIAHEINTPVGAIGSMHDTLVRAMVRLREYMESQHPEELATERRLKSLFDTIQDANEVIKSGTRRVGEIVRRLRSFARLDEAELKSINIHEGLEDTLTLLHHEIKHHITIERDYGDIPPIACYPGRLNQVFLNLLNNARQAIRDSGIIRIKTFVADGKVHIQISDNGHGIPPENLQKIFDPGFTTKGVGVGTGLGLSICYQIMQSHRGDLRVESKLGEGSTFTIVLPMNLEELLGLDKGASA